MRPGLRKYPDSRTGGPPYTPPLPGDRDVWYHGNERIGGIMGVFCRVAKGGSRFTKRKCSAGAVNGRGGGQDRWNTWRRRAAKGRESHRAAPWVKW
jgi:hypothetical protein